MRTTPAQWVARVSLSRMISSASASASSSDTPAAVNLSRAWASGRSSASTVGSTTSTSSVVHRVSRVSTKSGAAPAGSSVRASGGTRYSPAAHGSMSAASSSTDGSARSDFIAAIAAGPPAPVTRIRSGRWAGRATGAKRMGPVIGSSRWWQRWQRWRRPRARAGRPPGP